MNEEITYSKVKELIAKEMEKHQKKCIHISLSPEDVRDTLKRMRERLEEEMKNYSESSIST